MALANRSKSARRPNSVVWRNHKAPTTGADIRVKDYQSQFVVATPGAAAGGIARERQPPVASSARVGDHPGDSADPADHHRRHAERPEGHADGHGNPTGHVPLQYDGDRSSDQQQRGREDKQDTQHQIAHHRSGLQQYGAANQDQQRSKRLRSDNKSALDHEAPRPQAIPPPAAPLPPRPPRTATPHRTMPPSV